MSISGPLIVKNSRMVYVGSDVGLVSMKRKLSVVVTLLRFVSRVTVAR